jgi:hypothetical protein
VEGASVGDVKRSVALWLEAVQRYCPEQSEKDHEIFRVGQLPRTILLVYSGGAVGSINTKHGYARVTQRIPHRVFQVQTVPD